MHLTTIYSQVFRILLVVHFVATFELICKDHYDASNKMMEFSCGALGGMAYSSCIIRHRHRYCRLIRNWKRGKFNRAFLNSIDYVKCSNSYLSGDCFHEDMKYNGDNMNIGDEDKQESAEACRDHCRCFI